MHEQEKVKKQQKRAKNDGERPIQIGTLRPLRSVRAALQAEAGIKHWSLIQCGDFTTHHTHCLDAAWTQVWQKSWK